MSKKTEKNIGFRDKSRILSHSSSDDPMRRELFNEDDINEILKIIPDEKMTEKRHHLLELLNNITGFVASFFPLFTHNTPGKTDEILLLKQIDTSLQKTIKDISILRDKYGHKTFSLLSIVDPSLKKVGTYEYLNELIDKMQSLSYSIPSALNQLKWNNLFLISWNKNTAPTDSDLEQLSKAQDDAPVLMEMNDTYIFWGKKNDIWKSTKISAKDGSAFKYLGFSEEGRLVNIGNQFKDPHKIDALKMNHDQLKNQAGKKRGNNSQIAIPHLIAHLTKVYKEITQRNAVDDIQHGKNSSLGLHGKFYDFVQITLQILNKKYMENLPDSENPFSIPLGAHPESGLPHLSLSKHIARTLKAIDLD